MVIVNIGGEGEVPGAIDVNDLSALRRRKEVVLRGRIIVGSFMNLPIRDASVDFIVGNHVPLLGQMRLYAMQEAFRVLRRRADIRIHASAGGGIAMLEPLAEAGFHRIELAGTYALAVKP